MVLSVRAAVMHKSLIGWSTKKTLYRGKCQLYCAVDTSKKCNCTAVWTVVPTRKNRSACIDACDTKRVVGWAEKKCYVGKKCLFYLGR